MNNNRLIIMKEKNILRFILILPILCVLNTFTKAQVYINLGINQPPPLMGNIGTDKTICAGDNTSIGGTTTGGKEPYVYTWSPSNGLSSATIATPVASPSVTTTYSLTVTDANNCTSTNSITVTVESCSTGVNMASVGSEANYFIIAPNPNRGSFSVILSSTPVNNPLVLEIYNFLGKRIYSSSFIDRNTPFIIPIDMDGISKGIYLVKVSCENATYTEKLIIE